MKEAENFLRKGRVQSIFRSQYVNNSIEKNYRSDHYVKYYIVLQLIQELSQFDNNMTIDNQEVERKSKSIL